MTELRLPSLKALQALEAFTRTGSMVRAAERLGVTHGAVSKQIHALERQLGTVLLAGPKHDRVLTPAGQRLADAVSAAFAGIAAALPGAAGGGELVISAPGAFAMKWLIPRLAGFTAARVRVIEDDGPVDFGRRGVSAAIRLHKGPSPEGAKVTPFLDHHFGPVLAPGLFARVDRDPAKALALPRLHAETFPDGWAQWAAAAEETLPPAAAAPGFEHNSYLLEAAAAGQGVAVTAWAFAQPDIEAGRLVAPWGFRRLSTRFCLLRPALSADPALAELAAWLRREGRRGRTPDAVG